MSSSSRIPPLLEPFLGLPPAGALVVLTGVLGASTNWLVLRWAYALLHRQQQQQRGEGDDDVGVVLVSFMRDGAFWRDGAGKMGLDLDALRRAGKFAFVDGLSGLFLAAPSEPTAADATRDRVLRGARLDDVRRGIEAALADVRAARTVLVVDQVDALLAAAAGPASGVTSLSVQNMLLSLRERVHAAVLCLAADDPLLHPQGTTLEREHAALALSQAHAARTVVALRMLDTGAARDVSGVMRITDRGGNDDDEGEGAAGSRHEGGGDVEYLYYVAGDGSVKVFERGT